VRRHGRPQAEMIAIALAGGLAMALCGATARGDVSTRLINVDTARVLDDGQWQYGVDFRSFGAPDDEEYVSGHIRYAAGGYQLDVLGSFAERAEHMTGVGLLRYGGTNVELRAKRRLVQNGRATLSAIAGLEFPNTPAQDEEHLVLHLPVTIDVGDGTYGHIVPKFLFLEDNTLIVLGLAVEHDVSDELTLMAELSPTIIGANTRNSRGGLTDDSVWGVGVRWTPGEDDGWQVDLGWTNGKGQTSSFGAAPGILDSSALYLAVTLTR